MSNNNTDLKIIFYSKGDPHRKNLESIKRMCHLTKFYFCRCENEVYKNISILSRESFILLICNDKYISYKDPHLCQYKGNLKIIYGPQFFVFPEGIFTDKYDKETKGKCIYNTLSLWVEKLYQEMSKNFLIDMGQFPFGIDIDYFFKKPEKDMDFDCLVYIKDRSQDIVNKILNVLDLKGLSYNTIKYRNYNENDYKNLLYKSKFMLVLDRHESQGFALQEAMSTNTPLLVLDSTTMYDEIDQSDKSVYDYLKPKKLLCTSVPYWSDKCGIKIYSIDDLSVSIDILLDKLDSFKPREYIIDNLSDEVCMKRIKDWIFQ